MKSFIRNFNFLHQSDDYSCGKACAYMVTAAFGVRQQRRYLRKLLKTDLNMGTYQKDLVAALKTFGFRCQIVSFANKKDKITIKSALAHFFAEEYLAVACVDNNNHWIVVRGMRNGRVYIADPDPYGVKYHTLQKFYERVKNGSMVFVKRAK